MQKNEMKMGSEHCNNKPMFPYSNTKLFIQRWKPSSIRKVLVHRFNETQACDVSLPRFGISFVKKLHACKHMWGVQGYWGGIKFWDFQRNVKRVSFKQRIKKKENKIGLRLSHSYSPSTSSMEGPDETPMEVPLASKGVEIQIGHIFFPAELLCAIAL